MLRSARRIVMRLLVVIVVIVIGNNYYVEERAQIAPQVVPSEPQRSDTIRCGVY